MKHKNNTNITITGYVCTQLAEIINQKVKVFIKKKKMDINFNRKSDLATPEI